MDRLPTVNFSTTSLTSTHHTPAISPNELAAFSSTSISAVRPSKIILPTTMLPNPESLPLDTAHTPSTPAIEVNAEAADSDLHAGALTTTLPPQPPIQDDPFLARMQEHDHIFQETLEASRKTVEQILLIAQQIEAQLQRLAPTITQQKEGNTPAAISQQHTTAPMHTNSKMIDEKAHSYPSPLNTNYLRPSGDYNTAAAGTPWFKSTFYSFLPFLSGTRYASMATGPHTVPHSTHRSTATHGLVGPSADGTYTKALRISTHQVGSFQPAHLSSNWYQYTTAESPTTPPAEAHQCNRHIPYSLAPPTTPHMLLPRTLSTGTSYYCPPWPPPRRPITVTPPHLWSLEMTISPVTNPSDHLPQYCSLRHSPRLLQSLTIPPLNKESSTRVEYKPTPSATDKNLLRPP